jgi:hypothetical protein
MKMLVMKVKFMETEFRRSYEVYDDLFFNIGGGFDVDKIDANDSASALYKSREGTYNSLKTFYSIDVDKRNTVPFYQHQVI